MMIGYIFNTYSLGLVVFAFSIQILVLFETDNNELDFDVKSAIRRAKTDTCKKELLNFSTSKTRGGVQTLHRTCGQDRCKLRNTRIGCASNESLGLVKIEEFIPDLPQCLDSCYSYGHSHAGFNSVDLGCYCSDGEYIDTKTDNCRNHGQFDLYQVNSCILQPNLQASQINRRRVRIVFLFLLSGRLWPQVKRLFTLLYSEDHIYYFHVDNKDERLYLELSTLEREYSNIVLAKERFRTIWGSPLLLKVIIDSMKHLASLQWDYLINVSESDFPLKPLAEIEKYLSTSNSIYLKSHNIKGYNFIKKQGLNKYFYQCEDRVWRLGPRSIPTGIIYAGGSDWFALPKDFCDYIVVNLLNSSSIVMPLISLYNHTLLPAESFFHTIALNTEYCDRFVNNNLRMTNWNHRQGCKCQHRDVVDWCGCSPQIFKASDKIRLRQASMRPDILFSRKFDSTVCSSIIDYVESELIGTNKNLSGYPA